MLSWLLILGLLAQEPTPEKFIEIEAGRKIPLTLIKGVSSKTASPGDPVYLQTLFPILAGGQIAIPTGSFVSGSVVEAKRAGKVKGRASLQIRIETLILPNGTTRDFRGGLGSVDSATGERVEGEGTVKGPGNKLGDAKNVATAAGIGAGVGAAVGGLTTIGASGRANDVNSVIRRPAAGAGVGLLAGATAMLVATLFLRGPDAVLVKGTDVEMVLDAPMRFKADGPGAGTDPKEAETTESGLKKRK